MKNQKLTPHTIIKILEENKDEIRKHGVKKIGLFGSFRKGIAGKKSDIDFIVKFKKPKFDDYMELKFFLEKKFRKNIDLVTENSLKPAMKHIKEEALYAKKI